MPVNYIAQIRCTIQTDPTLELRQGDIIDLPIGSEGPYRSTTAVVMTADCDLAQSKHYGQLLLCPIVTSRIYFDELWTQKRVRSQAFSILEKAIKLFEAAAARADKLSASTTTISMLLQSESTMSLALSEIDELNADERSRLLNLARANTVVNYSTDSPTQRLINCSIIRESVTANVARKRINDSYKADLTNDSTDIVVLPDEDQNAEPVAIVLLRCPFSFPARDISLEGKQPYKLATRSKRLTPELKYLVAQKFGALFSRFGMPASIENDRDTAVDLLGDHA